MEINCEFCKTTFNYKSELFKHQTEDKTPCKKKYERKVLDETGIPKPTLKIDVLGILNMFKKF